MERKAMDMRHGDEPQPSHLVEHDVHAPLRENLLKPFVLAVGHRHRHRAHVDNLGIFVEDHPKPVELVFANLSGRVASPLQALRAGIETGEPVSVIANDTTPVCRQPHESLAVGEDGVHIVARQSVCHIECRDVVPLKKSVLSQQAQRHGKEITERGKSTQWLHLVFIDKLHFYLLQN